MKVSFVKSVKHLVKAIAIYVGNVATHLIELGKCRKQKIKHVKLDGKELSLVGAKRFMEHIDIVYRYGTLDSLERLRNYKPKMVTNEFIQKWRDLPEEPKEQEQQEISVQQ